MLVVWDICGLKQKKIVKRGGKESTKKKAGHAPW